MKLYLSLLLLLFANLSFAQRLNISGYWQGKMNHYENGKLVELDIEIYLVQDGKYLIGKSSIYDQNMLEERDLKGKVYRDLSMDINDILFHEIKNTNKLESCAKNYQFLIEERFGEAIKLEGWWQGKKDMSTCEKGLITLTKVEPRS